ncbi:putative DNA exonuclease [Pseudomonas phage Ep4]|uniref:DNA exonuclease n=1 Tax=Pseudomonas phage Ep4 TaxID=3057492 RepID=A0AAU9E7I6_9CAUD|nr:putative DNA exonuclease [Pseudomonas phage Ep4]
MDLSSLLGGLEDQFERTVQGRVLILDSDFACYQAAATVKKLPTAITRFQTLVETEVFVTGAELVRVHLTPRGCKKCMRHDYPTVKPYQAQRTGPKPVLLEPLRQAVMTHPWPEHWATFAWQDREADDGMMMDALQYGDNGIVLSGDKDLSITPGPYWIIDEGRLDIIDNRFGWIKTKQLTSSTKVVGHGTSFYWAQMLMGDPADNVKGLISHDGRPVGPVAAYQLLKDISEEGDAAELVIGLYGKIGQDPLAEAQCLWLRRSLEDCAYKYLCELGLQPRYQQWLDDIHGYHGQWLAMKQAQREEAKHDAMY